MSKRLTLLALVSLLVLSLAGCGSEPVPQDTKSAAAPAPAAKKEEPPATVYELTKDPITTHPDWTSKNISVMGAKVGDAGKDLEKNLGKVENTRTDSEKKEYLTIHQTNGVFAYTSFAGKVKRIEVYQVFADKVADEKLKTLLTKGDLALMRQLFGAEEKTEDNEGERSTEHSYESKGFSFVKFTVNGRSLYAIRFFEVKKPTT